MQCTSVVHGQAKYAFITSHRLQETVAVYPERTDAMIAASSGGTGRRRKALTLPPSVIPSGTRPAPRQDRGADNARQLGSKLLRLALTRRPSEHLPVNPHVLAR